MYTPRNKQLEGVVSDRGIVDEAFVRRALEEADFDTGRWIANQSYFNCPDEDPIALRLRANLITSACIYSEKYGLDDQIVDDALAIKTCGDARAFVDKVQLLLPKQTQAE